MTRTKIFLAIIAAAAMVFVFTPATTNAANGDTGAKCIAKTVNGKTTYSCTKSTDVCSAQTSSGVCQAADTFGIKPVGDDIGLGSKDLRKTATGIINVALSLLGIVAVVVILIGGFQWMTAGGNEEKVTEARKRIFQGIIGLAIILSAWAIAYFVIQQLSQQTGSGTVPTLKAT